MKAIVWSKENCPQCDTAKLMLTTHGVEFQENKIGTDYTREQLLEVVPNARSVPQVFIDGTLVGGLNELRLRLNEEV